MDSAHRPYLNTISGDIKEVKKLIRNQNPNVIDSNGNTALHYAAKHGNLQHLQAINSLH